MALKMTAIILFCCIFLFCGEVIAEPDLQFHQISDTSGRFRVIKRLGNRPDVHNQILGAPRNSYITVFEFIETKKSLRKIYETELVNPNNLFEFISQDGRFFVTLDETLAVGTNDRALVIYDLARHEHSKNALEDFMTEEQIKRLRPANVFPGRHWHALSNFVFSRYANKLYLGTPAICKADNDPFVVVDLPSRTAAIRPFEEYIVDNVMKNTLQQDFNFWIPKEDPEDLVKTEKTLLPKIMAGTNGKETYSFELSPDHHEYRLKKK